jgi:tellurite resistance protein TehA-like permease
MTPSWIIPPIGIAIATSTGLHIAGPWVEVFFWFGLAAFCLMFPLAVRRPSPPTAPTPPPPSVPRAP